MPAERIDSSIIFGLFNERVKKKKRCIMEGCFLHSGLLAKMHSFFPARGEAQGRLYAYRLPSDVQSSGLCKSEQRVTRRGIRMRILNLSLYPHFLHTCTRAVHTALAVSYARENNASLFVRDA